MKQKVLVTVSQASDGTYWCHTENDVYGGKLNSAGKTVKEAKDDLMVCVEDAREDFVENYEILIRSILAASPDTRVICGSLCSVTTAYAGTDGLTGERASELDDWIKQVCTDTGAYYADWSSALTNGGYLRPEYAEGSGRSLNNAGLSALLNWLRTHAAA